MRKKAKELGKDVDKWVDLLSKAINEMNEKKVVLLKRGDLIREEDAPLYKETIEELEEVKNFLFSPSGHVYDAYRYLQLNVFMKHESFFMDLFETNEFPCLFELFEFE